MARIDDLIALIADEQVRDDIARELRELRKRTSFGLVFERHIPEEVALLGYSATVGDRVIGRSWSPQKQPRQVLAVDSDS